MDEKKSIGEIILEMFKESISLAIVTVGILAGCACICMPEKIDIVIASAISAIAGLATGRGLA